MGVSSRLILGALTSPAGSLPELRSPSLEKIRNTSQASLGRLPAWYPRKKNVWIQYCFSWHGDPFPSCWSCFELRQVEARVLFFHETCSWCLRGPESLR